MTKKKAVYNPNAAYKWDPQEIFEVTGQQFASFYHALTQEINNPGGAPIAIKYEAFTELMNIFRKGVEDGIVTETSDLKTEEIKEEVNQLFKV